MNTWIMIDGALTMFGKGGVVHVEPIHDYRDGGVRFISGSQLLTNEKKELNRVKKTPEEIQELLRAV